MRGCIASKHWLSALEGAHLDAQLGRAGVFVRDEVLGNGHKVREGVALLQVLAVLVPGNSRPFKAGVRMFQCLCYKPKTGCMPSLLPQAEGGVQSLIHVCCATMHA